MKDSGYLFPNGKIIDYPTLIKNKINFERETGALRIRTTQQEVNVDFLAEKKPTEKQLAKIEQLMSNRKLVFEIVGTNNNILNGRGRIDKTILELKGLLNEFYRKPLLNKRKTN